MKRKVMITCAVAGNAPFNPKHPNFPITPEEIAASCIEAANAGAAIVHIHTRDPVTKQGCFDVGLFEDIVERVRASNVDVLINLTAGGGALYLPDPANEARGLPESDMRGVEARIEHLVACRPDIASIDVTTGNQVEGDMEFVYLNTTRTLRGMAKRFKELGVKPEIEVFQAGDLLFAKQMIKEGLIEGPPFIQFVLGVLWGAPADTETVTYMRNMAPADAVWTAMGIARSEFPMVAQSVLLGGHVRVGLEDNLYLDRGVFASNGQLVERAARIVEDIGCSVASPDEARALLGIKQRSQAAA